MARLTFIDAIIKVRQRICTTALTTLDIVLFSNGPRLKVGLDISTSFLEVLVLVFQMKADKLAPSGFGIEDLLSRASRRQGNDRSRAPLKRARCDENRSGKESGDGSMHLETRMSD